MLGKQTIDSFNTGESRGQSPSYSRNFQKLGRDLIGMDEIAVMDGERCILQIRGERPFFSKKYDITKHKNYRFLSDYEKKNHFDITEYMSTKLKLKADDKFDVFVCDLSAEKVGEEIPQSTFYEMVHRQKGRKVKPRGQNPGKADQKKLKMQSCRQNLHRACNKFSVNSKIVQKIILF